jgi:hypothetical protein
MVQGDDPSEVLTELGINQYPKVMQGVGRVAVNLSFAEEALNNLGQTLTGDPDAYRIWAHGLSSGAKTIRIRKLCELIRDESVKSRATAFCDKFTAMLKERNAVVHSLYVVSPNSVHRIGKGKLDKVSPHELDLLAKKIWDELWSYTGDLVRDVQRDRKKHRGKNK